MSNAPPGGFQPVQSLPEQPSRAPWLIVAALVAAALGGVLVGALLFGGGGGPAPTATAVAASPPVGRTPASTATAPLAETTPTGPASTSVAGSPSTASPPAASTTPDRTAPGSPVTGPSGSIPPDIARQIEDVIAEVPPIRGLEQLREVPYRLISREQFRQDLIELLELENDPEMRAAQERALKRLGLLPDDLDLEELLLELYGAGVGAFYQFEDETFYVIERDAPFGPLDRMYVAHEYDHALQDQHFDLAAFLDAEPTEGDLALAKLSVVEGDATWLMVLWAQQYLTLEEVIELLGESLEPADQELLERMPQILVRQLSFPYNEGMLFVSGIQQAGGWSAVDELFEATPTTTEHILHPEKYEAGEEPVDVEIEDDSAELGAGWSSVYEQTMGELNTHIWVAGGEEPEDPSFPGMLPEYPHADVAAGWGGDRLRMYEGPDDAWAIVWEIAWDTLPDMLEFTARAQELQSALDGVSMILETSEDRSWIFVASDQETLDDLRALGPP